MPKTKVDDELSELGCTDCLHYEPKTKTCQFYNLQLESNIQDLKFVLNSDVCNSFKPKKSGKTQKATKKKIKVIQFAMVKKSKKIPTELKSMIPKDVKFHINKETMNVINLAMSKRLPVLLEGHTGLGKSSLAKFIAQEINAVYVRVQFNGAKVPDELIGYDKPISGSLIWWDGTLSHYIRLAHKYPNTNFVFCLDEWNAATKSVQLSTRSLFDDDRCLLLPNQQHEILHLPNNVFIFATLNPSRLFSLYPGIERLNEADRNRFPLWIEMGFPGKGEEEKILKLHFPKGDSNLIAKLCLLAQKCRVALANGDIQTVVSTRTLIQIMQMYEVGIYFAIKSVLLDRLTPDERSIILKNIDYIFDIEYDGFDRGGRKGSK